jgi:hypothetical protein
MTTEKIVNNALFGKTKLASIKVELGLIDEIDKKNKETYIALEKADKAWKDYQDYLTRADTPYKNMLSARANYLKVTTDIGGLLIKTVKASTELGLNPEDIKGYSSLKQNIKTGNEVIDTIDTFKEPSTFQ